MTEIEKKFAAAALSVSARYGVRKTTMAEIAQEAGVSKPTLYAVFRNKDDALAGSIRLAKGDALAAMREEWASVDTLREKLDIFFDRIVVAGYDLLHGAPDADALDRGMGDASCEAIKQTRGWSAEALAEIFEPYGDAIARAGLDAKTLARFTVSTGMNAKRLAESRHDLLTQLAALRAIILVVLPPEGESV